jgi:methionyl-tRNA formyltransferase
MKIVFMGTPSAAVPSLDRLILDGHHVSAVYCQPDRAVDRRGRVRFSPIKKFAVENGIPVIQPLKLKTPEALELFASFKAELAVVVAYGRILPESFLNTMPFGAVNVHFSLLPKFRGAAPVNWAIVNGEQTTGVTTMLMDAGLDTGPILLQHETQIERDETSIGLTERLSLEGAELLSQTLRYFETINPRAQDNSLASYAPILSKSDGEINWNLTASEIENRVRGFQPFPTSFTFIGGTRLTLCRASASPAEVAGGTSGALPPGTIVYIGKEVFTVSCGGQTALDVRELQPEGKRRMDSRDFLNGSAVKLGDLLG